MTTDPELDAATKTRVQATYGKLPLHFEANQGQTDEQVKFLSRGSGYSLFLTGSEAVLSLTQSGGRGQKAKRETQESEQDAAQSAVVRMQLLGANPQPQMTGLEELPGKANYLTGNDPTKWRTHVPTYAKVRYESVYPGIDLVYYGNQRQLEYDFVVAPGANPGIIRLAFADLAGAVREPPLRIDDSGDLLLLTASGDVRLRKPLVYQEVNGTKQPISGRYVLNLQSQVVGFEVAAYDTTKPLVIDPVLEYSTYLGGSGEENGRGIAVDSSNRAYVTGFTRSTDFPTVNALQGTLVCCSGHAFVARLSTDGSTLEYATYLGGSNEDEGFDIAVDALGRAYVTGRTGSTNFPTINALDGTLDGDQDVFVARLSADGSILEYSTYLGGGHRETGFGITVDASDRAYVTGETTSFNFPTVNALQGTSGGGGRDAFVARLSADGSSLEYSTFLGGNGDSEAGSGIAVDAADRAYVTGYTDSTNFPLANALQSTFGGGSDFGDAFIVRFSADGSTLEYSTYLGGSSEDPATDIAVDASNRAYVTGFTRSTDFPTANALQGMHGGSTFDAFVARLSADGSTLEYATYLGGNSHDQGRSIAVDSANRAYVLGSTESPNFPTVDSLKGTPGGRDAFVAQLSADGSTLAYATYLGGNDVEESGGIAVDSSNRAYVTGLTESSDFPTANALDEMKSGSRDVFVARIAPDPDGDGFSPGTGDCDDNNAAIHPGATDLCNSVDDDCDGVIDEGETEVCNSADDDCDGTVDDGFDVGTSCSVGIGACQNNGMKICTLNGQGTECNATAGTSGTEVCNSLDDDCDGTVDDGFNVGASCSVGVGACQSSGTLRCAAGGLGTECNATPGSAGPEVCNNIDDDCDGTVDDSPTDAGQNCTTGQLGACSAGTIVCSAGTLSCNPTVSPSADFCGDGIDQDCNGQDSCAVQPVDTATGVTPVTLTFPTGTVVGTTTLTTSATGPLLPSGFRQGNPVRFYNLSTTTAVSDPFTICINYSGINFQTEADLKLLRFVTNSWVVLPTEVLDTGANRLCASTPALSVFALLEQTQPAVCGNLVRNTGEQCDDGNTNNNDACKNNCTDNVCGDSVVWTGVEQCDDGNITAGDGCDDQCAIEARSVTETVSGGAEVTTDTGGQGATPSQPVQAAVTPSTGGTVTITTSGDTGEGPSGFQLLTGVIQIEAPNGTANDPLMLVFTVDASLLPAGEDPLTIQITKNGGLVESCMGADGVAAPDPCVANRVVLGNGDLQITVLSSTASEWGVFHYTGCPPVPQTGCRHPAQANASSLNLKDKSTNRQDMLTWTWTKGAATTKADLGDPATDTAYGLCVYDQTGGTSTLKLRAVAPAAGTCKGKACWKETVTGFTYTDLEGTPEGVSSVVLKAGAAGKASLTVKGKGQNLAPPALPFTLPVTVQLQASNGQCWEAEYSADGVMKNDPGQFKAKGQ